MIRGLAMGTDGGAMYGLQGFAGLPQDQQTWSGLVDEKMNIAANGKGEVADRRGKSLIESPLGVPSSLLTK